MQTRRVIMMFVVVPTALLAGASPAFAGPDSDGQGNRDWGTVASNQAQLDTSGEDGSGGGMGRHSRSTTAADINGGFANSDNAFGITFNQDGDGDGDNGRLGVGNATRSAPHNEDSPSDGGNGRHATNNAELASVINPINGELTTTAGGTAEDVSDELKEGTSVDDD